MSTTTSVSSSSTAADIAAANRSAAQKLMTSLGAGSGIDVAALAQNLVDAERIPRENAINGKITKSDAQISGFSAIKFMLSDLKDAMAALRNRNDYNSLIPTSPDNAQFSVVADGSAEVGSHAVQVHQLARAQRSVTQGFAANDTVLNNGRNMVLNFAVGDVSSITPSVVTTQGAAGTTETATVDFAPLAAGESITVAGLTFTADPAQGLSANDVAQAFASLADGAVTGPSTALGTYSGTFTGYSTGTTISSQLEFVSSVANGDVGDLTATVSVGIAPVVSITQGVTGATESSQVTFVDMTAGQSLTVGGLKFTATESLTADQVAALYANLLSGQAPADPAVGDFSGTLTGFDSAAAIGDTVTFIANSPAINVTDLSVLAYSKSLNIPSGMDTPEGVVAAINASGLGLKATLFNTNDGSATPYRIMIVGEEGASHSFQFDFEYGAGSGNPGVSIDQGHGANQTATDSRVTVDGLTFTRNSNSLTDVLNGVTLNLKAVGASETTLTLARDNTTLVDKFRTMVTAYQNAFDILKEVADPESTLDTYGQTLVGDSTVVYLRSQLKSMFTGQSSTGGSDVNALWQMGVSIDQYGKMSLDEDKLNTALSDHFDDVVRTMTGGYNNLGSYSTLAAGFAGDAFKKLTTITSATGILQTRSDNASQKKVGYEADLEKLDVRMKSLLARYTKQFGNMESLIAQFNVTKSSLKSTFDAMNKASSSN